MIREGGRLLKRTGERVLNTVKILAEATLWALSVTLPSRPRVRQGGNDLAESTPAVPDAIPSGSPLDIVGPVPEELRRDPFAGGSVPWCIEEAEKEENRAREMMIWKVTMAVSWSVTVVALLKSFGAL
jgi:hypothetical protein